MIWNSYINFLKNYRISGLILVNFSKRMPNQLITLKKIKISINLGDQSRARCNENNYGDKFPKRTIVFKRKTKLCYF